MVQNVREIAGVLFLVAFASVGCSEKSKKTDTVEECAPGAEGCSEEPTVREDSSEAPSSTDIEDEKDVSGGEEPANECPPGTEGCPCDEAGLCGQSPAGNPMECLPGGICAEVPCEPGSLYCSCASGGCTDSLVCAGGLCVGENTSALTVEGDGAQACDILLDMGQMRAQKVVFPSGYRGGYFARGPQLGLSFGTKHGQGFVSPPVALELDGAKTETPSVKSIECYDAGGATIEAPGATLY